MQNPTYRRLSALRHICVGRVCGIFVSGDYGVSGTPKWLTKFNFIKDRLFLAGKQQNLLGTPKKLSVPGIPNINSGLVRKGKHTCGH